MKLPIHSKTVSYTKRGSNQTSSQQLYKHVNMDNVVKKGKTKIEREINENIKKKAGKYDVVAEVSRTQFELSGLFVCRMERSTRISFTRSFS